VALADGSDDQFLSALAAAGIPAHDGIPVVVAHGHNVCDVLSAGMSPGEAADELAHHAYAEDPGHPFDQYLRTMQAFVRVSTQTFCPGRAGAAYHHGGRVILVGLNAPSPPPQLPDVPDVIHFAPPPVQVAPRPKQTPSPVKGWHRRWHRRRWHQQWWHSVRAGPVRGPRCPAAVEEGVESVDDQDHRRSGSFRYCCVSGPVQQGGKPWAMMRCQFPTSAWPSHLLAYNIIR
jgi:hypothetical protein